MSGLSIPAPGSYTLRRGRPEPIELLAAEDAGQRPDCRNADGWLWLTYTVGDSSPRHWLALPEHLEVRS